MLGRLAEAVEASRAALDLHGTPDGAHNDDGLPSTLAIHADRLENAGRFREAVETNDRAATLRAADRAEEACGRIGVEDPFVAEYAGDVAGLAVEILEGLGEREEAVGP